MNRCIRQFLLPVALIVASAGGARTSHAQTTTVIGKTVTGADVRIETKSVVRDKGIITVTLRTLLQPPIKSAKGDLRSSRSIAMLDCATMKIATQESWYYLDDKGTKEGMHRKPGIPGYGLATKGSLGDVALVHFCKPGTAGKPPGNY